MPSILAIDPGDTTGVWMSEGHVHVQSPAYDFVSWFSHALDRADYCVEVVVMERMNLRDSRVRFAAKDLQKGLDVIGCVRWLCHVHELDLVEQWNRDKNQVSDLMLAEHGMLMTPKTKWRHANDAARHAVFYTNKLKKGTKT